MPKFKKRIAKPATYSVRRKDGTTARVHVGPKRLAHWADNFKKMKKAGLRIPAPWRHDEKAQPIRLDGDIQDIDAYNNGGFWERVWVSKTDGALWGEVDVPNEADAEKFNKTVKDVSLLAKPKWLDGDTGETWDDSLTHIALVTHPVAKDNSNGETPFIPSDDQTIAMSMADIELADDTVADEDPEMVNASGATVKDVIKLLSELETPITLPEDTNADNMLERLVVALQAMKAVMESKEGDEDGSVREPPKKSDDKPGPVAMSKELELAAKLLNEAGVTNGDVPFTADGLKARANESEQPHLITKMSAEDQAAVAFAQNVMTEQYKSRIEACVKQGKITPQMANEQGAPLLKDLAFAFDAEGKVQKTAADVVLEAWEAIPAGSCLTGQSPTTVKAQAGSLLGSDVKFSLGSTFEDHSNPHADAAPMTDEEVDAILKSQFESAGMSS